MASLGRSNYILVVAAAAICMLLTVSGAKLPRAAGAACITDGAVFPYWSTCFSPAVYYGQEVYTISGSQSRRLAPEYDETNSTYYMRLSDTGAQYKLMHNDSLESRLYVKQSDDVVLVNVKSERALGWRQEGEDEFWLVETDDPSAVASFQFAADGDVLLPCPLLYPPAQCVAYNIVTYSNSSIGLSSSEEDGVTYFKQGSGKGLPFLLVRDTSLKATKSVLAAPA